MVEPAVVGLMGAVVGAGISFGGQWWHTRWSAQREDWLREADAEEQTRMRLAELVRDVTSASAEYETELGRLSFSLLGRRTLRQHAEEKSGQMIADMDGFIAAVTKSGLWNASRRVAATTAAVLAVPEAAQDFDLVDSLETLTYVTAANPIVIEALTGRLLHERSEEKARQGFLDAKEEVRLARLEVVRHLARIQTRP